jgi:hypothetical protein
MKQNNYDGGGISCQFHQNDRQKSKATLSKLKSREKLKKEIQNLTGTYIMYVSNGEVYTVVLICTRKQWRGIKYKHAV